VALTFCDSFDFYTDLTTRYDFVFDNFIDTGGHSRTGVGCLQIASGAYGPGKNIAATNDCLIALAWNSNQPGDVVWFGCAGGGPHINAVGGTVGIYANGDGSVKAWGQGGWHTFGVSPIGILRFGVYNHIAARVVVGAAGSVKVWVNGALVIDVSGVDTRNPYIPANLFTNGFQLMGPGGIPTCYIDDLYVLDCSAAPNDDFLGACRIYAAVPTADGAVEWAPSVGTSNFPNVDSIPANTAVYNSSATVGQVDQYSHSLPGGVPSNSQLFALQHSQDMEVDLGSRSVTSDVAGVPNPGALALPTNWQIFAWPYDVDPTTGLSWVAADFPLLAGPKVTA
jgi:hypothetical protein